MLLLTNNAGNRIYLNLFLKTILIITLLFFFIFNCRDKDKIATFGSGTIEVDEIQIAPLLAGRINTIPFKEGDSFLEGDILVTLLGEEIESDVVAITASLEGSRDNVKLAESNFNNAKTELARMQELLKVGSITVQQLDQAKNRFTVTQSQYMAAKSQVKQINANLSRLNTRLRETILKAPKSGIVLTKNFEEGEVAMPGSPILSIADLRKVFLKIYVPETDLALVKLGKEAVVTVDGLNKQIPAKVIHIASKAEFTPRNVQTKDARARLVYAVKLEMENVDGILKPGMPAEGNILK